MPTFPPCPPDVPKLLNPLNPRHYWLLFTWIYFRPSRLKHYLYRADPELYRATGRAIFTTLRLPAYRNLYVMSLILTAVLPTGVAWAASAAQATPVDWRELAVGVGVGVAGGVAGGAGGSRLVFHLLEWPLARWLSRSDNDPFTRLKRHPAVWDELAAWLLPGTDRLLRACFSADLDRGLELAVQIAANPFQRWAVQRALSDFLAGHDDPLGALYYLAQTPALDDYLIVPAVRRQFRDFPSARLVLLGEVGQAFADGTGGESETSERWVWRLTKPLRRMRPAALSRFSNMFFVLIETEGALEEVETEIERRIKLTVDFRPDYEGVRTFRHGDEVANSFLAIESFLRVDSVESLASAYERLDWLVTLGDLTLRPKVIETIKALDFIENKRLSLCAAGLGVPRADCEDRRRSP